MKKNIVWILILIGLIVIALVWKNNGTSSDTLDTQEDILIEELETEESFIISDDDIIIDEIDPEVNAILEGQATVGVDTEISEEDQALIDEILQQITNSLEE